MDAKDEFAPQRALTAVGFLLAQVGAYAANRFAERTAALDLTPPQAGLLRLLIAQPGRSQRELADELGMPPSRFVQFADKLEDRGLIERKRNPDDRRQHALYLTEKGRTTLVELAGVAREAEEHLCRSLSAEEHKQLSELLVRIAADQGLMPGVHPGYKSV
ncbi:MarR family transcriptional regulator [Nocardia sp. CDC153]|uniref:MarR family winged helix-turn-helix transcriptional regulator n=1 Tax=unclassified Nocardia TaxID=2637762 RepID=UPI002DB608A2|nr:MULTISPECIES: MarR family transcriptional regulator [unclassified Nocardia]MEC3915666.1 MarR family transcriptional regulator [Nocardia sp. CDC160]MEC3957010.1 MarR family transcriptional regulator [Nocardia sp. CDC153]